jgi:chemotaxis response regulator CheB
VQPNPTAGEIAIIASDDIPDASLTIYNVLGIERGRYAMKLAKGQPTSITMPSADGMYYLRVTSAFGSRRLGVIVRK